MQRFGKPLAFLLLAAGVVALVYWRPGRGEDPRLDVTDDVRVCIERLRELHDALAAYEDLHGSLPAAEGAPFLHALLTPELWEDTPENRARLCCPKGGTYAVRDLAAWPLARFPTGGNEPLLACDNREGMNHGVVTNVLFADKTVRTLVLAREIEAGRVPDDTVVLRAGPASPLADLRKLRVD